MAPKSYRRRRRTSYRKRRGTKRVAYTSLRTTRSRTQSRRAVERKVKDNSFSTYVGTDMSSSAGGAGNAFCHSLNRIATGSDYNERIGRKIVMKDLIMSMQVQLAGDSTDSTVFNYAVVLDRAPTGTLPTPDEVYDNYGMRVLQNTPRFRILTHKQLSFRPSQDPSGTAHVSSGARMVFRRIPIKQIASYNAETEALGAIAGNMVIFMAWTSADVNCDIASKFRLRYTEQ